ncbi:hypothetical protein AKO1_013015 [Acrasis kona]|uniref:mRNA 5'-phosphatase n=1 Tax=Acrasis kona TaxID=1008807 RepID=A0AAW2YYX2_9EUKA
MVGVKDGLNPFKNITEALFGTKTMDESTRLLGDMLFTNLTKDNVEIQGKIGKVVDRSTQIPLSDLMSTVQTRSESALVHRHPNSEFVSSLSKQTFQHLNSILNKRYKDLQDAKANKDYKGPTMEYHRVLEVDRFYKDKNSSDWIRVSIDPDTEMKKRAIRKTRLQNLDYFCPHRCWDFRITVSEELELPLPSDKEVPICERRKDKLSYTFDMWRIDITVVKKSNMDASGVPIGEYTETYEVEMICESGVLLDHRKKCLEGQQNDLLFYTKTLLKNMRTLNKSCEEPKPQQQLPRPINNEEHASKKQRIQ